MSHLKSLLGILDEAGETVLSAGTGGLIEQLDGSAPYDSTVAIRFNPDGTIEKGVSINGGVIAWTPAGEWISPLSEASIDFDVRFTNMNVSIGPGNFTSEASADDVWIDLGSVRTYESNLAVAGEREFDCDFEVRDGGGAPPATASVNWQFHIDNVI